MRTSLALVAGSAVLALVAAGCGSSSSSSTTSSPATRSSPRATTTAASSGGTAATTTATTTTTPGKTGEVNPSGDIPDNQAYVRYALPRANVSLKVPEGWGRVNAPTYVLFTDKLNAIRAEVGKPVSPADETARLARTVPGYQKGTVSTVQRPAGRATRITYLARSAPNAVTGKRGTDAVEVYLFRHGGRELVLTLSGPKGADNVDPWRIVSTSVRFSG